MVNGASAKRQQAEHHTVVSLGRLRISVFYLLFSWSKIKARERTVRGWVGVEGLCEWAPAWCTGRAAGREGGGGHGVYGAGGGQGGEGGGARPPPVPPLTPHIALIPAYVQTYSAKFPSFSFSLSC